MKIKRKINKNMDRRLWGISGLNQFSGHNSSSRSVMTMNQLSQVLAIQNPEPRLILSGYETEMARANSFKSLEDSIVLDILEVYSPFTNNSSDEPDLVDVIFYDKVKDVVDLLRIKQYDKYDKKFGFEHRFLDSLANLREGDDIVGSRQLTRTNSEVSEGEYGFGVHLAVMPITEAGVSEDAIIISESAAKKLKYYTYETIRFDIGGKSIPLNIHGDDTYYKCIPDIGDHIGDSGVIVAIRELDDDFFGALFSFEELKDYDPLFDKVYSAKHKDGIVVDVNVIHTPKNAKYTMYEGTYSQLDAYAQTQSAHRERLIEKSNKWIDQYRTKAGDELHPILINSMRIASDKTNNLYKQDEMAEYTVEITIRYDNVPTLKHKLTTMHGGKGIISGVRPDNEMPLDSNGIRTEMLTNPNGTIHRMNLGGKYEGYLTTAVYMVNAKIKEMASRIDIRKSFDEVYNYVLPFLKIFGNEQYELIASLDANQRLSFVSHICAPGNNLQVLLAIDNIKTNPEIAEEIRRSPYAPNSDHFFINDNGTMTPSISKGMCELMYIFILNKTGETGLSVASAKLNHFGLPTAPNTELKQRMSYNGAPTKILSETETRLILSTAGVETLAELRDRNLNHDSHYKIYESILSAEKPTNIDQVIDRTKTPFTGDVPSQIFKTVTNAMGIDISVK